MITSVKSESSSLKTGLNFGYVWPISIVGALGGLLFGRDWIVIGGAKLSHAVLPRRLKIS
jgi:hypothetical protein